MTADVGAAESSAVQLTRMEGVLNRVADRVSDLRGRVDIHETEIGGLKSLTQSLKEGAEASKETAVALALALKDAKETQEATARAERVKDDTAWTPASKLIASIGAVVGIVAVLWAVLASLP